MATASRAALVATRSSRVVGGTRGKSFPSIATRSHRGASRASVVAAAAASEVPAEYVTLAADLVDAAAEITVKYFRTPLEIDDKNDASPVTIADKGAEAAMRALVRERFPTHAIFGEEEGIELGEGGSQEWTWVFDPIDGTKSTLNGEPISVRPCKSLGDAYLYSTTPYMFEGDNLSPYRAVAAAAKVPMFGCDCYAYGLLAAGHCDLVVEADLKPYDYMALVPIIKGAGGVFTDWKGGELRWEGSQEALAAGEYQGEVIAAGDEATHAAAIERMKLALGIYYCEK